MYPLDIYGLNYNTSTNTGIPIVNTEDYTELVPRVRPR
jgi:hypothetical protein